MSDELKSDTDRAPQSYSSLIAHHSSLMTVLTNRFGTYALLGLAGLSALVPAMIWGIPAGHDMPSHLRFAQTLFDAISAGTLHPGWGAEANGGFGDPGIRLYPPLLYYLLAVTRALSRNWYNSIILGFVALSVLGALGMYFWARCLLPRNLAVVAGVLYAFIPYRVNEFYGASLLAEYAAASLLPFAFAFVVRICRWQRRRDTGGLAIAFALLVLANLPVAVIASLSLLFYALLIIPRRAFWRTLSSLAIAVAAGLAASAFYWTTMLAELPWMKSAAAGSNVNAASYFDYRLNFVFSPFALGNTNSWLSSMLTLATLSMAFAAAVMFCSAYRKKLGWELKSVFALLVLALFMSTDLSRPVWAVIPKLKEVQFPWRWLVVSSCAVPLLTAASIPFWKEQMKGRFRWAAILALGGVLFSLSYSVARTREANYLPRFEFGAASKSIFAGDSLDYWHEPVWMNERPAPMAEIEAGERKFKITSWEPETRTFWIGPGPAQDIRIRSFYYPYWVAQGSGQTLNTKPAFDGSLLISVPAEEASVQLEFQEPRRTRIAFIVSGATWLLLFAALLFSSIRERAEIHKKG
jgi:hypothetical protein